MEPLSSATPVAVASGTAPLSVKLTVRSMMAAALVFAGALSGSAEAGSNLCAPDELVVFSCRIGDKAVSVCRSADASSSSGYLQYRFGSLVSGAAPELALPEGRSIPPNSAHGDIDAFAGGGGSWLRFSNGPTTYTVYTGIGKWGPDGAIREKAGIFIARDGQRLARIECNDKPASEVSRDWLDKMGVTSGDSAFFDFSD
jgi:hypothetical protein